MEACVLTEPSLSDEEAYFVLEPFFRETQALFVEHGLTRCKQVRFELDSEAHDTPRHFAGCAEDGSHIIAAPQLADRSIDEVAAVLAHEFGHACDFLYPARFLVADGELVQRWGTAWNARAAITDERAAYNQRMQWERRDPGEVERAADLIAQHVTGRVIRYGGPCMLQTYGAGAAPRPAGLL